MPPLLAILAISACKSEVVPEPEFVDPILTLETDGYYHEGSVEVEGQATGLHDLTVNDQPLTLEGDTYRTTVNLDRGVNLIEVKAYDGHDDSHFRRRGVVSGEWASPDETVNDALTLRVNRSGLGKVGNIVSGLVVAQDLETTIMGANPLYYNDFFGGDITAGLSNLEFDPMQIDMDPRPGVLALEVVIPNLTVTVNATGEIVFIDYDQDLTLSATQAVITGNIQAEVTNNGDLSMTLTNTTVQLDGFEYDVSLLPDLFEDYVAVDTIRGIIEDQLVEQVETRVPALVAGILDDFDFSFQTEVLGMNIGVAATLDDLYSDQDGLQLQTHLDVALDQADGKTYRGYLYAGSTNLPHPSRTDDVGMSLSDNLLNNILLQVWRSGLLDLDLDSAEGDIEPAFLSQLGATNAARVVVDAAVPPVFVERNGQAQIQVTELNVLIETPNGERGEYLNASVTAFVDLQLSANAGVISLELGEPELVIDVRDSDWGADPNTLSDLLAERLPINTLLALLGAIEFPLPEFAGITINQADAERDSSGVHTSIGATL